MLYGLLLIAANLGQADEPIPLRRLELEQLFEQARPHLEQVLEIPEGGFAWPRLRRLTDEEFAEQEDPTVRKLLGKSFPELKEQSAARTFQAVEAALARVSVARWSERYGVILIRNSLDPMLLEAWTAWKPVGERERTVRGVLQLALAQEAIRAYLYQRYELARRLDDCRSAEEMQVLHTVIEGRVHWWTRHVADRLGTVAYMPLLVQRHAAGGDHAVDPGERRMCQVALARRYDAAAKGLEFFDTLERRGAAITDRQVFNRPPTQWTWIDRPMLYWSAERSRRPDLKALLDGLGGSLPEAAWRVEAQDFQPEMVRQVASLYGETKRADAVLPYWDEACSLVWAGKTDPSRHVGLSAVRFDSADRARSYHGFALDLQRKQDEVLSSTCNGTYCVLSSTTRERTVRGADSAVCVDKRIQLKAGPREVALAVLLVRAGCLVVEVTWHGMEADLEWAERTVAQLLDHVRKCE